MIEETNVVREHLLKLGFEILSIHEECVIATKRFIYASDIRQIEHLLGAWYIFDNKLFISVKLTKPLVKFIG